MFISKLIFVGICFIGLFLILGITTLVLEIILRVQSIRLYFKCDENRERAKILLNFYSDEMITIIEAGVHARRFKYLLFGLLGAIMTPIASRLMTIKVLNDTIKHVKSV